MQTYEEVIWGWSEGEFILLAPAYVGFPILSLTTWSVHGQCIFIVLILQPSLLLLMELEQKPLDIFLSWQGLRP